MVLEMKTDIESNVGKHAFEVAGLGLAPFKFVGASENRITYPDGSSKAGGCCDYCFTGIALECHVQSSDGKRFKVGCNCIEKVGDSGLMKAYKTSPEYRAIQRAKVAAKNKAVFDALQSTIAANEARLSAMPHPRGFTDRATGAALTMLDQVKWLLNNCGASGRASTLKMLQKTLA